MSKVISDKRLVETYYTNYSDGVFHQEIKTLNNEIMLNGASQQMSIQGLQMIK